ncbi:hypothetical protein [Pseudomonas frederiksbergensis]|uniref:Uncharacterized protein n=1 Tax=Pseudomonas frederiksbergensis TaxID=104087 RepID=A0A423KIY2_9PSED|nr:hypothetical protein [Pseudomonas frederiksbergensis]RON53110.1 hypothetical protein BK665_15820 [Pseudomonas frederiksbergensis]
MSNGHGIETPASKIATALATLGLAIRLNAEVNQGRIDVSIFHRAVNIYTGGDGLRLPAYPEATQADLDGGIYNIVQIALSSSALTVDETLLQVFGPIAYIKVSSLLGIRVMIHQVRNAFAHNPWRPRWVVYKKYRKAYEIELDNGTAFTFDATSLDGDGLNPEQFGGLERWVEVLQHCERLVASNPNIA